MEVWANKELSLSQVSKIGTVSRIVIYQEVTSFDGGCFSKAGRDEHCWVVAMIWIGGCRGGAFCVSHSAVVRNAFRP